MIKVNVVGEGWLLSGARVETPANSFRLMRKKSGELVLQTAIYWSQGLSGGIEWRDLETECEP